MGHSWGMSYSLKNICCFRGNFYSSQQVCTAQLSSKRNYHSPEREESDRMIAKNLFSLQNSTTLHHHPQCADVPIMHFQKTAHHEGKKIFQEVKLMKKALYFLKANFAHSDVKTLFAL